jgi:GGDEF domain-containing protein
VTDDRFFERLRDDAEPLRYAPDDAAMSRMAARIRARVTAPPTVAQLLSAWMRPLTLSFATLALVVSLGVAWYETNEAVPIETTIAQSNIDVEMAGYSFGE